jgi:hypothetical protein
VLCCALLCPAALQQATSATGIPQGAAAVAKVRLCLDAMGQMIGTPALRVMTQLVMAGERPG